MDKILDSMLYDSLLKLVFFVNFFLIVFFRFLI